MITTKPSNSIAARRQAAPSSSQTSLVIEGNGRQTRIMTMINREKGIVEIEYHDLSSPFQRI